MDRNVIYINCLYLAEYYMNVDIPTPLKILILNYSGHIRVGKRSFAWIHYK